MGSDMGAKVLFLDIEGVLNSWRSSIAFGGMPFNIIGKDRAMFDEVAIGLIARICEAAGAQVILSSSWRQEGYWDRIGPALGLPIVDRTPSILGGCRGDEIAAWLGEHPGVACYAVLDDMAEAGAGHQGRFIRTSMKEGFTYANAEKLAELLGIRIHDCCKRPLPPSDVPALDWSDA